MDWCCKLHHGRRSHAVIEVRKQVVRAVLVGGDDGRVGSYPVPPLIGQTTDEKRLKTEPVREVPVDGSRASEDQHSLSPYRRGGGRRASLH